MTDSSYMAEALSNGATAARTATTKKHVAALLASFEPADPKTESPAEKERARRIARLEQGVRNLAKNLEEWGVTDGTPADAAAALRALKTVQNKSIAAINSLNDVRLGVAEKTTRAPRAEKPAASAPEVEPEGDGTGDPQEGTEVEPTAVEQADPETPEEIDARIKEQRQARSGPPIGGSRGETDPNAEDGF